MLFTKLARIIAILALVLGVAQVVMGFSIAQELMGPYEEASARYGNSGRMIDRGFYSSLFAVALGTLAEISFAVRNRFGISN